MTVEPSVLAGISDRMLESRADLIDRFTIELNSACNLRCRYCHQNAEWFTPLSPMPPEMWNNVVAYCRDNGVRRMDVTGSGEVTIADGWREKCEALLNLGVELCLTTNMTRLLSREEIDTLSRFAEITVSIDSTDRDNLRKVRKSGDVRTIVYNVAMLRSTCLVKGLKGPHLAFGVVMYAEMIEDLPRLGALAGVLGCNVFVVQDLVQYHGIKDPVTPIWSLSGEEAKRAALALRDWRRVLDSNPAIGIFMPDQLRSQMEAFCAKALAEQGPSVEAPPELPTSGSFRLKTTHSTAPKLAETRDCFDPWTFVQVLSNGNVRPCCAASSALGTIGEDGDLQTILNSDRARALRSEILTGDLKPDCVNCSFKSPISLDEYRKKFAHRIMGEPIPTDPPTLEPPLAVQVPEPPSVQEEELPTVTSESESQTDLSLTPDLVVVVPAPPWPTATRLVSAIVPRHWTHVRTALRNARNAVARNSANS